jgi:hypothetical protein
MSFMAAVPVKGHLPLTRDLLKDLRRDRVPVAVFDNGSPPWESVALQAMASGSVTIRSRPKASIHQMWNEALELFGFDSHVAILNNDIRLARGTLARMAEALDAHPEYAIVSADYPERALGGNPCRDCGVDEVDQVAAAGGFAGFAFMVQRGWGHRFPEELRWWYGDNDAILSAHADGLKVGVVDGAMVTHVGGGSQTGRWRHDVKRSVEIAADEAWFLAKWDRARTLHSTS